MTDYENLSALVDIHYALEKQKVATDLRIQSLQEQEKQDPHTAFVHERLCELTKYVRGVVEPKVISHPVWETWAGGIKGLSPMLLGKVMGRCRIELLTTRSKLRAHAGVAPHQGRKKGKKLDYDAELKSVLWVIARQFIFIQGKYADQYYRFKEYYIARAGRDNITVMATPRGSWVCQNCGAEFITKRDITVCCASPRVDKITKTEPDGVLYRGHIDFMARRKMMVLFLDHLYEVWRRSEGLEWRPSYVHEKMGHITVIHPEEMIDREGWSPNAA